MGVPDWALSIAILERFHGATAQSKRPQTGTNPYASAKKYFVDAVRFDDEQFNEYFLRILEYKKEAFIQESWDPSHKVGINLFDKFARSIAETHFKNLCAHYAELGRSMPPDIIDDQLFEKFLWNAAYWERGLHPDSERLLLNQARSIRVSPSVLSWMIEHVKEIDHRRKKPVKAIGSAAINQHDV
jgi:hypothetical protein